MNKEAHEAPTSAGFWVEILDAGPPICGAVHRPLMEAVGFEGWLELLSALQGAEREAITDWDKTPPAHP